MVASMAAPDEAVPRGSPALCDAFSDPGTGRKENEDACGTYVEGDTHVLVAVADGVSGEEGAAIASRTAIDVTLKAYRKSPAEWGPSKRLYRAVQQANIEIHDRALVVTELRRMATTLTAIVVQGHTVHAAHVGDTRLYSVRGGEIVRRTKDHNLARRRRRTDSGKQKDDPARSMLTRSLGRDLIVAVDRITFPVVRGDVLVVCSDGLYTVLDDAEIRDIVMVHAPSTACRALVEAANARGTPDNVTAAVVQVTADAPVTPPGAWRRFLSRLR
jgi:PPM family protein phosphatase